MASLIVFGVIPQIDMAQEEAGELIVAINKLRRKIPLEKIKRMATEEVEFTDIEYKFVADLIDEVADMQIMVDQLKIICGEESVAERIQFKTDRLKGRIQDRCLHPEGWKSCYVSEEAWHYDYCPVCGKENHDT